MVICYLGIGSNLGNRRKNITLAITKIKRLKDTKVIRVSKVIQTSPVGGPPGQGKFLNSALKIITGLSPVSLLNHLQKIEISLGRLKKHIYQGPRTIDLDILFYGNEVIKDKNLQIPHPRIYQRDFVMRPLLEII